MERDFKWFSGHPAALVFGTRILRDLRFAPISASFGFAAKRDVQVEKDL